ncbi:MAG: hypothetical protein DHS20C12_15850 [Pseudohongiella sp.]|nr:MAG: hypothetical protein DHS20C12_15850 [Pseudohongiella sp.]
MQSVESLSAADNSVNLLIMPVDVELYRLTAAGPEPQAEWTRTTASYLESAVNRQIQNLGYEVTPGQSAPFSAGSTENQLERLHEAVGQMILTHSVTLEAVPLPTKAGVFDWSLGESARVLAADNNANYALFVYFRDSFSTGGRIAMQIAAAAVAGVVIPGGQQAAFASLVDLDTGDIVWFNFALSTQGDSREIEGVEGAVEELLESFPRNTQS